MEELRRAIELDHNDSGSRHFHAFILSFLGRHDEAIAEAKRAKELEPRNPWRWLQVGRVHAYARRHDEAIKQLNDTIELFPDLAFTYYSLGMVYADKEMYEEAISAHQKAISLGLRDATRRANLANSYALSGRRDKALEILDELLESEKQMWVSPVAIATVYVGLGDKECAFQWLDKALDTRDGELALAKVLPPLDPLRDDPRFEEMLRRMNFPE